MARRQRPEGARALHVHICVRCMCTLRTLRALHGCVRVHVHCTRALHVCTRWLAGAALTARACGGGEST